MFGLTLSVKMTYLQNHIDELIEKNIKEIDLETYVEEEYEFRKCLKVDFLVIENAKTLESISIDGNSLNEKIKKVSFKNCPELAKIRLIHHEITDVEISDCPKLRDVNFYDNKLSDIKGLLDLLNHEIITSIWLNDNNFDSTLVPFTKFKKLRLLGLSGNCFRGSLEPLSDLKDLKFLVFEKTHINSGLEFLVMNLEQFFCGYHKDVNYEVVNIQDKLLDYAHYDEKNPDMIVRSEMSDQSRLLKEWLADYFRD